MNGDVLEAIYNYLLTITLKKYSDIICEVTKVERRASFNWANARFLAQKSSMQGIYGGYIAIPGQWHWCC